MAYARKTKDVWEVQGHYGHGYGWERVTVEETLYDAREQLKCYEENEPRVPHRIIKRREKVTV